MLKRLTDIVLSLAGIVILSPLFFVFSFVVAFSSPGGVFYRQRRVGLYGKEFTLYKFRTMRPGSDKKGLLTVGGADPRITPVGRVLRKYKMDELPQLFNVLNGTMSVVGPRPEVKKYVDLYSAAQRKVLLVRPGITDPASLAFFNENDLLARSADPEDTYLREVMPAKLELNLRYIENRSWIQDIKIIARTVARVFGK